jgi:hypothetical protein
MIKKAILAIILTTTFGTASPAAVINLVSNGDFETGDLRGFTVVDPANSLLAGVSNDSGGNVAFFNTTPGDFGGIRQSVQTQAGHIYNYYFSIAYTALENNFFSFSLDGVEVLQGSIVGRGSFFNFSGGFTTLDSDTPIEFSFTTGNSYFLLDNVSLSDFGPAEAVPEPATWAMMIGGFGLIGGAMRRRQKVSTAVSHA